MTCVAKPIADFKMVPRRFQQRGRHGAGPELGVIIPGLADHFRRLLQADREQRRQVRAGWRAVNRARVTDQGVRQPHVQMPVVPAMRLEIVNAAGERHALNAVCTLRRVARERQEMRAG